MYVCIHTHTHTYIHVTGYYSTIRKDLILPFAATSIDVENNLLNRIS